MKRIVFLFALVLLPSCAHLGLPGGEQRQRVELWNEAHLALKALDFSRASELFGRLSREYPETIEGRESLFYLGTIRLDPRNVDWDPQPAEDLLRRYVQLESTPRTQVFRLPEATTLLQLAHQLNIPPQQRVPGLQPGVVTREVEVPTRVVVPARESRALEAEVERLRNQVAERDATIRQQREELERIRRTLTRPTQ